MVNEFKTTASKAFRTTKKYLKVAIPIVIASVYSSIYHSAIAEGSRNSIQQDSNKYDYGDAVNAVANSDMFSGHISATISCIKAEQSSDYYKAVVAIAEASDMFSADKYRAIKNM